jgi:hypothetical protein
MFCKYKKVGLNSGQRQKSLLRSPFKLIFRKLCTTLSTQIVDKVRAFFRCPPPDSNARRAMRLERDRNGTAARRRYDAAAASADARICVQALLKRRAEAKVTAAKNFQES